MNGRWVFEEQRYDGWPWEPIGSVEEASDGMVIAHLRHWQLESVTDDEIVFNNHYWNLLRPPEDQIDTGRRRFRRVASS